MASLITKFEGSPLDRGLKLEWSGFWLRDAISRKQCATELRWQLISNRKSYVSFLLQQKSMTLNDLERQFTAVSSLFMRAGQRQGAVTKRLRLKSRCFHYIGLPLGYTLAICILSLTTKFKGIPIKFQAKFRIHLSYVCVTGVYCDETTASRIMPFSLQSS